MGLGASAPRELLPRGVEGTLPEDAATSSANETFRPRGEGATWEEYTAKGSWIPGENFSHWVVGKGGPFLGLPTSGCYIPGQVLWVLPHTPTVWLLSVARVCIPQHSTKPPKILNDNSVNMTSPNNSVDMTSPNNSSTNTTTRHRETQSRGTTHTKGRCTRDRSSNTRTQKTSTVCQRPHRKKIQDYHHGIIVRE